MLCCSGIYSSSIHRYTDTNCSRLFTVHHLTRFRLILMHSDRLTNKTASIYTSTTGILGRVKDDFVALLYTYANSRPTERCRGLSTLEKGLTAQSKSFYSLTAEVLETRYQNPKPSFKTVRGLRQDFAPNSVGAVTCQCPVFRTED